MEIKICGITTTEAAHIAREAGATMLGFVFAPSRRRISLEKARAIIATLPDTVEKVGVFVNASVHEICRVAEEVGLTMVQLHGEESPLTVASIPYPVIKAFPITEVEHHGKYDPTFFLVDSPPTTYRGGSGITFDWDDVQKTTLPMHNTFVAGGLTPDNVHEAIIQTNCVGVDVSSGVETNGKKDHTKIQAFIRRAKEAGGEI